MFYCSIIKVQGLYPTSLLLTRCLRQRYISYHLCFSLSRTFLFYFLKFFQKIKSLETFKKISQLLTITFDKKISCFPALSPHRFVATAISILQHLFDIVKNFFHFTFQHNLLRQIVNNAKIAIIAFYSGKYIIRKILTFQSFIPHFHDNETYTTTFFDICQHIFEYFFPNKLPQNML